MKSRSLQVAQWFGPLIFIGVLFYWPLGKIIGLGLHGDWLSAISTTRVFSILWFTIWQAAVSALLTLLIGIPGAYLFYNKRFTGQRLVRALITVPFILPTIVVAIGFTSLRKLPLISNLLFAHSAIPAIICAHIFMNYSIIVHTVGGAWTTLDANCESAAALDGAGRFRTFISITLPQLKSSVISASALVFLYCLTSFGIILVLGGGNVNSLETEIFTAATQYLDLPKTSGLALIQTTLTIIILFVVQRAVRNPIMQEDIPSDSSRAYIDRRDWPVILISGLFLIFLFILPIATLFGQAFTYEGHHSLVNFAHLSGNGARDLLSITVGQAAMNTLRNMAISSTLALIIGLTVLFILSRRSKNRYQRIFQRFMDILFQLPIGVSSVVLGFGYLITFSGGPFPLRASWLVTPLVQALLATPLVIRFIYPSLQTINSELLDAAATDKATPGQIWWRIELPIIRGVIITAAAYTAIISIGEFGAASFLAYGNQGTLPTVLYQLIARPGGQNYGMAMAASGILIFSVFLLVYLVGLIDLIRLNYSKAEIRRTFVESLRLTLTFHAKRRKSAPTVHGVASTTRKDGSPLDR